MEEALIKIMSSVAYLTLTLTLTLTLIGGIIRSCPLWHTGYRHLERALTLTQPNPNPTLTLIGYRHLEWGNS